MTARIALTLAATLAAALAQGPRGNSPADMVATLLQFDRNADGKLSKDEVPERMQGLFARGDADNDGFLTKAELEKMAAAQGPGPGGPGGPGGRGFPNPLLAALDLNGDGQLSPEEIKLAPSSLAKLDKNNDGTLSQDELRPPMGPGMRGGEGRGEGRGPRDHDHE
jgi:Ca2+-binding EF-hand superfamily protein